MAVIDPVLALVLRGALALLLAGAAAHKLRDLHAFRVALGDYRLVPWALTGLLAPGLVAAELSIAALLVSPAARPFGFAAAAALLALYGLAIAVNLARGRRDLDCGCFGPGVHVGLGGGLLARNALLVAAALAGLAPVAPRPLGALDAATVAAALLFLAVAHAAGTRLLANHSAQRSAA
ncbi:MAG TPA: MauE/DoxX family redox-associated membrane protein [Myxococcota bacterium]